MSESSTIRWDQDADGVVILTLDDPKAVGQHDERRLPGVDPRDRRPAVGRAGRDHRRDHHLGQEDVLRRRRPQRPEGGHAATTREDGRQFVRDAKAVLRRLETLGRPVVAAINGAALGGGWRSRWPAITGSSSTTRRSSSASPRSSSGCCPAPAASPARVRMFGIVGGADAAAAAGQGVPAGRGARSSGWSTRSCRRARS